MGRASPAQNSFAGGELSPLLEGRQDLAKYPIGVRKLRNFLPLVQGPARKRGGTRYVASVFDPTVTLALYPFVKTQTDTVMLGFGDHSVVFFVDRAPVNVTGSPDYDAGTTYARGEYVMFDSVQYRSLVDANLANDPDVSPTFWNAQDAYEIYSPYAAADLFDAEGLFVLSIEQSGDVLFIAAGANYRQQTLSRTSNTSWAFADYSPTDGPFGPQNIVTADSVTVSGATGTVDLTNHAANDPVPNGTVNRLIRIEETDKSATPPWETDKRIAGVGENPQNLKRRSDGHLYNCATNQVVGVGEVEIRTGSVKPTHTEGTFGDGDGKPLYSGSTLFAIRVGVDWTYLHSGYGIGNITSCDGTTADVVTNAGLQWPASIISPGSYRWALGAWYTGHYSTAVAFWRDRLVWAGGQQVQSSVAGDYYSHAGDMFGEVLPDSAINVTISAGKSDDVLWMMAFSGVLVLGTGGGLRSWQEITQNQVFGPANNKFEPKCGLGARRIRPIDADTALLFVQAGGRFLRELPIFDPSDRDVQSTDLTSFSEHMTETGIIATAYTASPNPTVWGLRADGKLAACTYNRAEEVIAWSLHDFGGFIESIAAMPGPVVGVDDLYLSMRRAINCETVRYVEVLLPPHSKPNDPWLACYQDCSLTYDGAQAGTLTPGNDAITPGALNVSFLSSGSVFQAGYVGRYITARYYNFDTEQWATAVALITSYTNASHVHCTIIAAFPPPITKQLTDEGEVCEMVTTPGVIASGDWRLSATLIENLEHLEGEVVRVTVDGADIANPTVTNGEITISRPGSVVHVGRPMRAYVQTMNIEAGAQDGTSQGKLKKFNSVTFRVFETLGGQYGPSPDGLLNDVPYAITGTMDAAPSLFNGDASALWNDGYETEGRVTFVHDCGQPCTLLAIYPQTNVSDQVTGGRR